MSATTQYVPYKVKDMSIDDCGRTEIKLAEAEMPIITALCKEFGVSKPLPVKPLKSSTMVNRRGILPM
jgi:adenosylhomocysteinase